MQNLVSLLYAQKGDIFYLIFGINFLKLGLRKKDREINSSLRLYKAWGKKIVNEKIEKIKEKI